MKQLSIFFILFLFSSLLWSQTGHKHNLDNSNHRFIENKGQWDSLVLFESQLPNAKVFVTKKGLVYSLRDNATYNKYIKAMHDGEFDYDSVQTFQTVAISLEFLQAANLKNSTGLYPHNEKRNYLLGADRTKWGKNVLSYDEIETKEIYPNIDFNLSHHNNSVKYEFKVKNSGDYREIKLKFEGHEGLEISENGELIIKNSLANIIEDKPFAYQYVRGKYREISCAYVKYSDDVIGFDLGKNYNRRFPVIIDPQLIFSTASGSTADNWGNTACLDNSGNLYSGGTIFSTPSNGFPATMGSFQQTFQGGGTDIGILKFDSSGQNLIYATYLGGNFSEIPTSIVSNSKQELFILGVTSSSNFPGAVNSFSGGLFETPVGGYNFENGTDIIVIKLNADGTDIIKSRYVGGPYNDGNNFKLNTSFNNRLSVINYGDELRGEIIIDSAENIYIASSTNNRAYFLSDDENRSTEFPVKNAFQSTFGGGFQDGVVFKVDASLDSLVWSSYLGGAGPDAAYGLKLASDNSVYVTGIGFDSLFSTNSDALNPNPLGFYDAYIAKISPDGKNILNYTYLGTPFKDASYFIELDQEENVYVLGQTFGDYGHSSDSIYFNDNEGIFIHKLGPKLDTSFFFSTIGDTLGDFLPNISPTAFLVNECQNIFIAGWGGETNYGSTGNTNNMEVSPNAIKPTSDGSDFYLAVYLKDMDSLLYATYFGVDGVNEHVDGGTSRFSDQGIVYQSVCAGCGGGDFVVFPNDSEGEYPKQNASSNCNNGVFKYDLSSLNAAIGTQKGCGPLTQYFTNNTVGGVDYHWFFGDGTDTLVLTKETIEHIYTTPGRYQVMMITTDLTTCKRRDTTFKFINVSDRLSYRNFQDTLCNKDQLMWSYYSDNDFSYTWTPNKGLSNNKIKNPTITADSTIQYFVKLVDTLGCERNDTIDFFIPYFNPNLDLSILAGCQHNSIPKIEMKANYSSNFKPDSIDWKINNFAVKTIDSTFIFTPTVFGNHAVVAKTTLENCSFKDSSSIHLPQIKVPNIITPNGDGTNETFVIEGLEAGGTWKTLILNRWGKEIYYNDAYNNSWNAPLESSGTYFYEIEAPDGTKCKGWLQVVK